MNGVDLSVGAWVLGTVGLGIALAIFGYVRKQPPGRQELVDLADQIHDGAMAFLRRENSMLAVFVAVVATLLALGIGTGTAVAYLAGATSSGLAGFIGMKAATRANVRTAHAASTEGQRKALRVSFFGAAVMGLAVASLGLLGIGVFYVVVGGGGAGDLPRFSEVIAGFAMGASSIALFCPGRWGDLHKGRGCRC